MALKSWNKVTPTLAKVIINANERGFLFKSCRLVKLREAGKEYETRESKQPARPAEQPESAYPALRRDAYGSGCF